MERNSAAKALTYHTERTHSTAGKFSRYHDNMNKAWNWALKTGIYKELPRDPVKADRVLLEVFELKRSDRGNLMSLRDLQRILRRRLRERK